MVGNGRYQRTSPLHPIPLRTHCLISPLAAISLRASTAYLQQNRQELQHADAPAPVKQWAQALPDWIEVREAPIPIDPDLEALGKGEQEAIALADLYRSESPVLLLLDERAACEHAAARNIASTGTLGVLRAASARGWIDLAAALDRLRQTNFRVTSVWLQELLAEKAEQRKKEE